MEIDDPVGPTPPPQEAGSANQPLGPPLSGALPTPERNTTPSPIVRARNTATGA